MSLFLLTETVSVVVFFRFIIFIFLIFTAYHPSFRKFPISMSVLGYIYFGYLTQNGYAGYIFYIFRQIYRCIRKHLKYKYNRNSDNTDKETYRRIKNGSRR